MLDYGLFRYASKQEVLDKSVRYWNPGKTRFWLDTGVDLVMGAREGYVIHDVDGRRLIDLHINGGTFNLGHRNPELIETLRTALDYFDIGNHWFPSVARTALAEALVAVSPGMRYAVFAPGGAEAADIALKSARYATKRRKIVSIIKGYHGHAGLSVATGDERFSKIFLSDRPDEFAQVPFNDLAAMEAALKGGGEVGCFVGVKVLQILARPETRANVRAVSEFFAEGFAELIRRHPDVIVGLRQRGTVMGVEFDHPEGAVAASRGLYENGIWAIFSSLDKRVLQFKPGALMSRALCEEVLDRFDAAFPRIRTLAAELGRS